MLSGSAGWLLAVVLICAVWICLLIRKGPSVALSAAMVMSFAFPVWIKQEVFGLPFNVSTSIACIALLGYTFHPQGKIISPLTLLDACIELMFLTHVLADSMAAGLTLALPCRAYGEWFLPYLAGRFAIRDRNDLRVIAPWVVGVLVILGISACIETVTKVNLFEQVFGNRPVELAKRSVERFGLKRAFGNAMHPIYFGMLIVVLMPWQVCLWKSFESSRVRAMAAFAAVTTLAGIVCTVSRTPLMTVLVTVSLVLALRYRPLRWPLGLSIAMAIAGFLAFPIPVTDAISRWTGGGDRVRLIEVDGKVVEFSGSRSRLLVLPTYADALLKAGPTGYGSEALSTFPPKIPYMEGKAELSDSMKVIDNAYVVMALRFGWLGGSCLVMLFLAAIMTGLSLHFDRPDQLLPGTIACLLTVIASFSLLMVSMNYDFGFPILWTMGILSGLASARSRQCAERNPVRR